jgi:phosphoglycerol transferase MdoB-like AlkP superfamily enzyme
MRAHDSASGAGHPAGRATSEPSPQHTHPLSHQAAGTAVSLLVTVWSLSMLTRITLAALGWAGIDHDPSSLLTAFVHGAVLDALSASVMAAAVLAFGAITHLGAPDGLLRRLRRTSGFAVAAAAAGFVAVAELLFWNEFDARFNFIAVDYLIYTVEVIGNIRESYPLPALLGALLVFGLGAAGLRERIWPVRAQPAWPLRDRAVVVVFAVLAGAIAATSAVGMDGTLDMVPGLRGNVRNQELARNGPVSFVAALRSNELSFRRFYPTLDDAQVLRLAGEWPRPAALTRTGRHAVERRAASLLVSAVARRPRHVVIVQVESLSAEFLGAFGDPRGLTPNLDRLAAQGLLFTQLYATGTRTVRGLEALSAGLPPLPGQSLVRRPGSAGMQTLGAVLRTHDFEATFLYGGYGYFDNMNAYFSSTGYGVRDRSDIPGERVGFANVWGIADEYLFDDAIAWMDRAAAGGRRQLLHLMTTSNHRPYTYPDGRIDIVSKTGRAGAVKYTDWAIGEFIEHARTRPWFADTLFVIVADHCASVAGKTRIPPSRYHIPAIFYAPAHIEPGRMSMLASQIDLVPTIVGRLGLDEATEFFGQDLLGTTVRERAYLGNYQEIGLLTPGRDGTRDLVVLSPPRRMAQYRIEADGTPRPVPVDRGKAEQAIAEYQLTDDLVQKGRYRSVPARGVAASGPASSAVDAGT